MATQWVPLRVSAETEASLKRVRESMGRAYENGQIAHGPTDKGTVPLYQVIDYLVQHYQRHRERRSKSQRKRALERKQCRVPTTTSSQASTLAILVSSAPCTLATPESAGQVASASPTNVSLAGAQHSGVEVQERKVV